LGPREVLLGRIVGPKRRVASCFHGEVRGSLLDSKPEMLLSRQFQKRQEGRNDEAARFSLNQGPKGDLWLATQALNHVLLLFLDGVFERLDLMDGLVVLVLLVGLEDSSERLDQLVDGRIHLYFVGFFDALPVRGRVPPHEVLAASLPTGGQLVGRLFEPHVLQKALHQLAARIDGFSVLVGLL
jgi:hypothetical protein